MNPEKKHLITRMRLKDALIIILGSTLLTVAVKYILDPSGLVTGGVSGLAIIVKSISGQNLPFEIPLWVTNVALNVPIFLYAWAKDGARSLIRTGLAFVVNSVELWIFPDYQLFPIDNLFLVSLFGGLLFGLSSGILLSVRATSGGTDLLGKALHRTFRSVSVGTLIQILDGIVVILGFVTFGLERSLYALVSIFIMGRLTDLVVDTGKKAKMCMIFSDSIDDIADSIIHDLDRGCTSLHGTGMYSGKDKNVLMCVCSKSDLPLVKDIVKLHDPNAFFIISNISEAMGEGFSSLKNGNAL